MRYIVVTPSRGLVHSRTIEAVMANVHDPANWHHFIDWKVTHDLPIPDCDERLAEVGMESGADAIWFVEEDVLPPPGALAASFRLLDEYAVVAVDYPVGAPSEGWGCLVRDAAGEIEWCGLGATLIRREVFETLPRPWFSTDTMWVQHGGGVWNPRPSPVPNERRFGQQDIFFCMALRAAGFRIGQVPGMIAGHAKLDKMGAPGTNVGYHSISIRERILKQYPG